MKEIDRDYPTRMSELALGKKEVTVSLTYPTLSFSLLRMTMKTVTLDRVKTCTIRHLSLQITQQAVIRWMTTLSETFSENLR